MTRATGRVLLWIALSASPGLSFAAATPQKGPEGEGELLELERERQRELEELKLELDRELRELRREGADASEERAELLQEYYEERAELEREFSERRGELLEEDLENRDADGERARRAEVLRELSLLESERDRELRQVDQELERELRIAREEARREGKPEKYRDKASRLRAKHYEKISSIERRFEEKRAHLLRDVRASSIEPERGRLQDRYDGGEAREDGPPRELDVCHVPPGNPSKRRTLSLPEPAVRSHLQHGDYIGRCR